MEMNSEIIVGLVLNEGWMVWVGESRKRLRNAENLINFRRTIWGWIAVDMTRQSLYHIIDSGDGMKPELRDLQGTCSWAEYGVR